MGVAVSSFVDGCGFSHTLRSAASGAGVSPHRHSLDVLLDVLEVGESPGKLPAIDCLCGLAGVLEGHAEVRAPRAGALRVLDLGGGVSDHFVGGCSVGIVLSTRLLMRLFTASRIEIF